jgi:hypothetical protein
MTSEMQRVPPLFDTFETDLQLFKIEVRGDTLTINQKLTFIVPFFLFIV